MTCSAEFLQVTVAALHDSIGIELGHSAFFDEAAFYPLHFHKLINLIYSISIGSRHPSLLDVVATRVVSRTRLVLIKGQSALITLISTETGRLKASLAVDSNVTLFAVRFGYYLVIVDPIMSNNLWQKFSQ